MSHNIQASANEKFGKWITSIHKLHQTIPGFHQWRKTVNSKPIINEHPFKNQIVNWNPSISMLIHTSLQFPRKIEIIDTQEKLASMVKDFEWYNEYTVILQTTTETYTPLVSIIQISSFEKDYFIDGITLFDKIPDKLSTFFQDATKVKIFHNSLHILLLQQNFNIFTVAMLNCQEAYEKLRHIPNISLTEMVSDLLGIKLNTSEAIDWNVRPLNNDIIKNIRDETKCLFTCWIKIKDSSTFSEFGPFPKSIAEALQTTKVTDRHVEIAWLSYMDSLPVSHRKLFEIVGQYKLFKSLFNWRDHLAKEMDVHPNILMTTKNLQFITRAMPSTEKQLFYPALQIKNWFVTENHAKHILMIIKRQRDTMFHDRTPIHITSHNNLQQHFKEGKNLPKIVESSNIKKLSNTRYARKQRRHRHNRRQQKEHGLHNTKTVTKSRITTKKATNKRVSAFLRMAIRYNVTQEDIVTHIKRIPKSL